MHGKYWHCVVGDFKSYIWKSTPYFIKLNWGSNKIVLFKITT